MVRGESYEYKPEFSALNPNDIETASAESLRSNGFIFTKCTDVNTNNSTLLFNISGGVQYEDVLSGDKKPPAIPSQASIQRCLRMDGLSKIGITGRHHIAFDMLGHFNFFEHGEEGAKELAIKSALDVLQGLRIQDLYATLHPDDGVSQKIFENAGIHIKQDTKNVHVCNQQRRSGTRVELGRVVDEQCIEMWNIVFTTHEGIGESREQLARVAFDSGASIDRLVAAANGLSSNYDGEHWQEVIRLMPNIDGEHACRIADFARGAAVLCESGVTPGPKSKEYVARKIFHELVRSEIDYSGIGIESVLETTIQAHGLSTNPESLIRTYQKEQDRIFKLVLRGEKVVAKEVKRHGQNPSQEDYANYKQTYGLDADIVDLLISQQS